MDHGPVASARDWSTSETLSAKMIRRKGVSSPVFDFGFGFGFGFDLGFGFGFGFGFDLGSSLAAPDPNPDPDADSLVRPLGEATTMATKEDAQREKLEDRT